MRLLKIAVFGASKKKYEKRLPIHPGQLDWIEQEIRSNLFFERGYGRSFGLEDAYFADKCGGVIDRKTLMNECDVALIAKPLLADFEEMPTGMIHWGWPHCVQQRDITQAAIDRQLTLIAWEAMHEWSDDGEWQLHTFHKNNEIAGYAGVHHAMNLMGIDGNYGPNCRAAVLSFGSVSRGAIKGLQSRGITEIEVYTQPHLYHAATRMAGVKAHKIATNALGNLISRDDNLEKKPLIESLASCDIIVNGILQDTDHPLMFVHQDEIHRLKDRCLIVDISCDEGMAFFFARPTSFDKPIFREKNVYYYGVDHTPSYLWDAASWEISKSLLPYLPVVMGGPDSWNKDLTIRKAIEIRKGEILNPKIISFQGR